MKVVYLSRSNSGKPHAFVSEQANAIRNNFKIDIRHFIITRGGIQGFIQSLLSFRKYLRSNNIDIIHVHYGLWALLAVIGKISTFGKQKILITFHGSDINKKKERKFSLIGAMFSAHNILVSDKMVKYFDRNYTVIPCGIDTEVKLELRQPTRIKNNWTENDFIVLFSSSFDRPVKDPGFAFSVMEAFSRTSTKRIKFIELKGYNRDQISALMQAADVLLMCSVSEGSPQVVKEAILNALPVISNDIGDVPEICSGVDNCFIVKKEVGEYIKYLQVLSKGRARIQNRQPTIEKYNNTLISKRIYDLYTEVLQ